MSVTERWIVVVGLLVLAWRGLTWLVGRWADREAAQQRKTLDQIMRASTPPQAPGLRSDHRRIS